MIGGCTGCRTTFGHCPGEVGQSSMHTGMVLEMVMQAGLDHAPHPVERLLAALGLELTACSHDFIMAFNLGPELSHALFFQGIAQRPGFFIGQVRHNKAMHTAAYQKKTVPEMPLMAAPSGR